MAKVIKPVIENKVYSEIIFRLGTHKFYVNKFVEHFVENDDDLFRSEQTKERSVLARQMNYLLNEGFLKVVTEEKKGKKFKHNIKKYYVDFDKIIDEFLNFYLNYLISKDNISNKEIKLYMRIKEDEKANRSINPKIPYEKYAYIEAINKLKEPSFVKKVKENKIIGFLFRRIIEEPRQLDTDFNKFTLEDYFYLLINSGVFKYFSEDIESNFFQNLIGEGIDVKANERVFDYMEESLKKDYKFFAFEFLPLFDHSNSGTIIYWFSRELPYSFAQVLKKGFEESDKDFYNL